MSWPNINNNAINTSRIRHTHVIYTGHEKKSVWSLPRIFMGALPWHMWPTFYTVQDIHLNRNCKSAAELSLLRLALTAKNTVVTQPYKMHADHLTRRPTPCGPRSTNVG